jgi:hypothetical protein
MQEDERVGGEWGGRGEQEDRQGGRGGGGGEQCPLTHLCRVRAARGSQVRTVPSVPYLTFRNVSSVPYRTVRTVPFLALACAYTHKASSRDVVHFGLYLTS